MKREEEVKGIHIGKEEVRLSLCTDDTILDVETPSDATKRAGGVVQGM
jgi:hypothetical protein